MCCSEDTRGSNRQTDHNWAAPLPQTFKTLPRSDGGRIPTPPFPIGGPVVDPCRPGPFAFVASPNPARLDVQKHFGNFNRNDDHGAVWIIAGTVWRNHERISGTQI